MSTFAFEIVNSFNERWHEVDVLLEHAQKDDIAQNNSLYDAICRATVLLTVSQLEAFIKDVTKAVVRDINTYSRFADTPLALKRTFCRDFIEISNDNPKESEGRVKRLISVMDQLEPKFLAESFLVEGEYEYRKNPSPGVISRICFNFGIRNIFSWFESERLSSAFSGTRSDLEDMIIEMRTALLNGLEHFPYTILTDEIGIREQNGESNNSSRTMWQTFLDDLLKNRNDIAHGSVLINSLSLAELTSFRSKLTILEYAIVAVLCYKVCTK